MPKFKSVLTPKGRMWIPEDKESLNTQKGKECVDFGIIKTVVGSDGKLDFLKEEVKKEEKKESKSSRKIKDASSEEKEEKKEDSKNA